MALWAFDSQMARSQAESDIPGDSINRRLKTDPTEALVTGKAVVQPPGVSPGSITVDPFNDYVPGLRSTSRATIQPVVYFPYAHVPFLKRGSGGLANANIAIPDFFYADLSLSSSFMFTDNVHQNTNRQSDLVVQLTLRINSILQLTDSLQLQLAGNLSYYQALGDDSISGFGFQDSLYFDDTFRFDPGVGLIGNTLFLTQLSWNRQLDTWDILAGDRFSISDKIMDDPFVNGQFKRAIEYANIASVSIGRLLPIEARLSLSGQHDNYWYNHTFEAYQRSEDSLTARLAVERDTMRFKPFTEYTIRRVDYTLDNPGRNGTIQEAHLGAKGPVTDQMNLEGSIGYGHVDATQTAAAQDAFLWRLALDHLMNRTTRHQLSLSRHLAPSTTTLQSVLTEYQYRIGHTMGLATLWLGANKSMSETQAESSLDTEHWTAYASFSYEVAKNLTCTLEYQYVTWDSYHSAGYDENRVTLKADWNF